jgi:hypothetical protein
LCRDEALPDSENQPSYDSPRRLTQPPNNSSWRLTPPPYKLLSTEPFLPGWSPISLERVLR